MAPFTAHYHGLLAKRRLGPLCAGRLCLANQRNFISRPSEEIARRYRGDTAADFFLTARAAIRNRWQRRRHLDCILDTYARSTAFIRVWYRGPPARNQSSTS